MLILSSVSKRYNDTIVLAPTDLQVPAGETTVLIGPSGCGKSTLLRLIVGLIQPNTGNVTLGEIKLEPTNLLDMRQRMGYVIQEGGLFPHITARRNVTLLADYLKWPTERTGERVEELARLVHLDTDVLSRYPTQLSGGQRQRVALMRALMPDPEVLLLDEPLAALDPMIRYDLQEELRVIFDALGKTVVLVTHDIAEAVFFAHEIVLMRKGNIVQKGAPRDLIERPANAFVEQFLRAQRQVRLTQGGQ